MELLLVRHAQTLANVAGALDTAHPGADLTTLGDDQVRALEEALAEERIDAVWVSPRLRTRRTARALLERRGLEPVVRDGLVEVDAGDLEMSTDLDDVLAYYTVVSSWIAGDLDARMPGGEDGHEAIGRFDAVVAEILASGADRVAVVAHGAILRGWCGVRVPDVGAALASEHPLPNTGIVRVTVEGDVLTVTQWDQQDVMRPGGSDEV